MWMRDVGKIHFCLSFIRNSFSLSLSLIHFIYLHNKCMHKHSKIPHSFEHFVLSLTVFISLKNIQQNIIIIVYRFINLCWPLLFQFAVKVFRR